MRVFQEEIFGPVTALTTFKDEAEAIEIAGGTAAFVGFQATDPLHGAEFWRLSALVSAREKEKKELTEFVTRGEPMLKSRAWE